MNALRNRKRLLVIIGMVVTVSWCVGDYAYSDIGAREKTFEYRSTSRVFSAGYMVPELQRIYGYYRNFKEALREKKHKERVAIEATLKGNEKGKAITPEESEKKPKTGKGKKIHGDINRDGVVNATDLAILAAAYNTVKGDKRYNKLADLNKDKVVNICDLYILRVTYGRIIEYVSNGVRNKIIKARIAKKPKTGKGKKIHGDINRDGVVNATDLAILAAAYNTVKGDKRYNKLADLNKDKVVNICDLEILRITFGRIVDSLSHKVRNKIIKARIAKKPKTGKGKKIHGDINRDGVVNATDLAILAAAYNTVKGDKKYNKRADLNNDKAVNECDLDVLRVTYGRMK